MTRADAPTHLEPIAIEEIRAAGRRIAGVALRTPLVRLNLEDTPADVYLKLENLQPIGSFKIRGAANVIAQMAPEELAQGVWTASAGNMGQGLAWCARERGVNCTVVVPETAPATKLNAIRRLGASVVTVSLAEFFETFSTRQREGLAGTFVHAFSDRRMIAGNGTIGLEVLEDLPDVDVILCPYGGGGLSCGIASAVKAISQQVEVFACEPASAAPLHASWSAASPVVPSFQRTFIDGAGGQRVYPEMFGLARGLLAGALAVPVEAVAGAIRTLAERNRIVAEGAGALSVAAALAGLARGGKVCCIVSGGNIDASVLAAILNGEVPP